MVPEWWGTKGFSVSVTSLRPTSPDDLNTQPSGPEAWMCIRNIWASWKKDVYLSTLHIEILFRSSGVKLKIFNFNSIPSVSGTSENTLPIRAAVSIPELSGSFLKNVNAWDPTLDKLNQNVWVYQEPGHVPKAIQMIFICSLIGEPLPCTGTITTEHQTTPSPNGESLFGALDIIFPSYDLHKGYHHCPLSQVFLSLKFRDLFFFFFVKISPCSVLHIKWRDSYSKEIGEYSPTFAQLCNFSCSSCNKLCSPTQSKSFAKILSFYTPHHTAPY